MVELRISGDDSTAVDLHLDAAQRHAALHVTSLSPRAARVLVKVPGPCSVVVVILRELPLRAMQFLTPAGMSCWFDTVLVWPLTVMAPENVRLDQW
jgi:hypothetical protein